MINWYGGCLATLYTDGHLLCKHVSCLLYWGNWVIIERLIHSNNAFMSICLHERISFS